LVPAVSINALDAIANYFTRISPGQRSINHGILNHGGTRVLKISFLENVECIEEGEATDGGAGVDGGVGSAFTRRQIRHQIFSPFFSLAVFCIRVISHKEE